MRLPALLLLGLVAASALPSSLAARPPGSSCGTVSPDSREQCCQTKVDQNTEDSWCKDNYPELYGPPLGASCSTVSPGSRKECCQTKVDDNTEDSWCKQKYPELYTPVLGSSCNTVAPDAREECCQTKVDQNTEDSWCKDNYPELYGPPLGSSCSTVSPVDRKDCCQTKVDDNTEDSWCKEKYPELYGPPGSSCGTVSPDDREQCCQTKAQDGTEDSWCADNYPDAGGPDNTADYPYMAYINGPFGKCGGSLVAPGYVLTAAQCVFGDGEPASADNLTVWVGGQWHEIEAVLVDTDKAQFDEFQNPKSQNSWDIAMLALANDSDASYVALPTSDVPSMGAWVTQTAWQTPRREVETALVNVWDGCPPSWADQMCVGGSGYLQACPKDKGSPLLLSSTQVGLASGPGCDGTSSDYGNFIKLADKDILEQITVWLNSREGSDNSGLDDNVRAWLQEANTYLYGRRRS